MHCWGSHAPLQPLSQPTEMTRTARADYPRAVLRDRSKSRSGLDPSIRKDGAGQHNWGSIADERQLEIEAIQDEMHEAGMDEDEDVNALNTASAPATIPKCMSPHLSNRNAQINSFCFISKAPASEKPELIPGTVHMSEEELEKARQYRKNAFKKQGGKSLYVLLDSFADPQCPSNRHRPCSYCPHLRGRCPCCPCP